MGKSRTRVIKCPKQKRLVEVTYAMVGSWFSRDYDIQSCPAMNDWGGCERQCKSVLAQPPKAMDWYARY